MVDSGGVWLFIINLATSLLTAITGMGGGTVLIGLLPLFIAPSALIPVHATTQLASNVSRAWFSRHLIHWQFVLMFAWGALGGALVFGLLVRWLTLDFIPLLIGIYILLTQWSASVNRLLRRLDNFYLIGFVQMGVGLFVGAPGPLHMPLLLKTYDNATAVSVGSVMMSLVHAGKLVVFMLLGFVFTDYWRLILVMVLAASLGSWLGVKLRAYVPIAWLQRLMPWLLTAIALNIIIHNGRQLWHFG